MKHLKILILSIVLMVFLAPNVYAEIKVFTKTVRQVITDDQSLDEAKAAAIERAKREALEQTGTYLEALTEVKASNNEDFTKDEILALTAGVTKVNVISQKKTEGETPAIEMVLKIEVDTAILDERVKKMLNDRALQKKYDESQKDREAKAIQNNDLKAKNQKIQERLAETEKEKEELKKTIAENSAAKERIVQSERLEAVEKDLNNDIRQAKANVDDYRSNSTASSYGSNDYRRYYDSRNDETPDQTDEEPYNYDTAHGYTKTWRN